MILNQFHTALEGQLNCKSNYLAQELVLSVKLEISFKKYIVIKMINHISEVKDYGFNHESPS